jgi:hypothetical protein
MSAGGREGVCVYCVNSKAQLSSNCLRGKTVKPIRLRKLHYNLYFRDGNGAKQIRIYEIFFFTDFKLLFEGSDQKCE